MYHYIKGKVTMKFSGGIVIESAGIGYEIHVTDNCPAYMSDHHEEMLIYTKVIYKEDDVSIFGFTDRDTLDVFCKLMTVNGVGAKAAMAVLSAVTLDDLKKAIAFDDPAPVMKAQGIGKKIAQRILLELKDKLPAGAGEQQFSSAGKATGEKEEAIIGLLSLGYSRSEAQEAVNNVEPESPTTENYMKLALRSLMRR